MHCDFLQGLERGSWSGLARTVYVPFHTGLGKRWQGYELELRVLDLERKPAKTLYTLGVEFLMEKFTFKKVKLGKF